MKEESKPKILIATGRTVSMACLSRRSMSSKDGDHRRGPRKFFSFDSTKSASSRRTPSESSIDSQARGPAVATANLRPSRR